jgi:hypothetical protein
LSLVEVEMDAVGVCWVASERHGHRPKFLP